VDFFFALFVGRLAAQFLFAVGAYSLNLRRVGVASDAALLLSRVRYSNHVVGDSVRFLFVAITGRSDPEFRLQNLAGNPVPGETVHERGHRLGDSRFYSRDGLALKGWRAALTG
jgi:hypothetical protein